jgi:hypothetical protein
MMGPLLYAQGGLGGRFHAWHPRCTAIAADGKRKPQEDHDVTGSYDDIAAQLARLQRLPAAHPGVVSVYLNTQWSDEHLLAGHENELAAFRNQLPERLRRLVVGQIHATRWETASAILHRASERLDLQEHSDEVVDVDDVLTEAAKGGRAVAGPGTLEAARRGAIHRLYILADLRRPGRACERCGALQEAGPTCWLCGGPAREVELAAAVVDRVQSTGGTVETVLAHAGLAAAGGLAARLRYGL